LALGAALHVIPDATPVDEARDVGDGVCLMRGAEPLNQFICSVWCAAALRRSLGFNGSAGCSRRGQEHEREKSGTETHEVPQSKGGANSTLTA